MGARGAHFRRNWYAGFLGALALASTLSSCASLGPQAVKASRTDYNIALRNTGDEQLLLNLVRLKYRDNPMFLEATAVTTSFLFSPELSASATSGPEVDTSYGIGGSYVYEEKPTVSYAPLQGKDFVQRILSPISLETLLLLATSGWSSERLLRTCVNYMNGLPNAPRASGPTPSVAPNYEQFVRAARLFRKLELSEAIRGGVREQNGARATYITINPKGRGTPEFRALAGLLRLDPKRSAFLFKRDRGATRSDEIHVETRSLIGVMYYLSQSVEVPEVDRRLGRVSLTLDNQGRPFDWQQVTDGIMRIRSSSTEPDKAAVKIRYRGNWFYIDDSDLASKSSFGLLTQLFALQSGGAESVAPVLTIPVG